MKKYTSLLLMFCLFFTVGCQNTDETQSTRQVEVASPGGVKEAVAGPAFPDEPEETSLSDHRETPPDLFAETTLSDHMRTQLDLSALKITISLSGRAGPWEDGYHEKTFGLTGWEACVQQIYQYYWQPNGKEGVEEFEGRWALLFSAPVWAPGSVCVGIALNPYDTFGIHSLGEGRLLWEWIDEEISVEAVKAYLGDRVDWIGPERTADPYYLFQEDFGVWKVFTNQDGSHIRTDLPILVQPEDVACDLKNLPPWDDSYGHGSEAWQEEYLNPASARTGARWKAINKYIGMLDKAPDEILDDYTITEHPYYGERYRDDETGALFTFADEGRCSAIRIPVGVILPELLTGGKDGALFLKEMGLPASWGESGTSFGRNFNYFFDDGHGIYFLAGGNDMALTKDDWVIIK